MHFWGTLFAPAMFSYSFYLFSFSFLRIQKWPKQMGFFQFLSFNGTGPLTGQSFTVLPLGIGVDFSCDSSVLRASPPSSSGPCTWGDIIACKRNLATSGKWRVCCEFVHPTVRKRPETWKHPGFLKSTPFWRKSLPNFSHLSPSPQHRKKHCFSKVSGASNPAPLSAVFSFRWRWRRWNGWDRKLETMCIFSWLLV